MSYVFNTYSDSSSLTVKERSPAPNSNRSVKGFNLVPESVSFPILVSPEDPDSSPLVKAPMNSKTALKLISSSPRPPFNADTITEGEMSSNIRMMVADIPRHPHISTPRCLDLIVESEDFNSNASIFKGLALASPWYQNGNILNYIQESDCSTDTKLQLVKEFTNSLEILHRHNIVHGNFCPNNILITQDRKTVITDIGLHTVRQRTSHQVFFNLSPSGIYKSPEELSISEAVTKPTKNMDIYSWACSVYAIFIGREPLLGAGSYQRLLNSIVQVYQSGYTTLARPEDMDLRLWEIVRSCWNFTEDERPSLAKIVVDLENL